MNKVAIKEHVYELDNKPSISVKQIGDLHFDEHFDLKKLDIIKDALDSSETDYVMFTGDLIDYTNFLYKNTMLMNKLLKWIESIATNHKLIMGYGNHDIFKKTNDGWKEDYCKNFINDLKSIENLHLLGIDPMYEDDKISVISPFIPYKYYENETGKESKEVLLETLKGIKNLIESMSFDKIKFLILHSPVFIDSKEMLEFIKYFDFVLSGHMHNGIVPPILDKLVHNDLGLISPDGRILPKNTRGVKTIKTDNEDTNLIITGGITKLTNSSKLGMFNNLFPMSMEDIKINKKVLK